MGKIVKYCSSCDEGFAERFTFCPVCGSSLQAFEMNPVGGDMTEPLPTAPNFVAESPVQEVEPQFVAEPPVEEVEPQFIAAETQPEIPVAAETFAAAETPATAAFAENDHEDHVVDHDYGYLDLEDEEEEEEVPVYAAAAAAVAAPVIDESYHITMIEEQNGGQRNSLLIGASIFMIVFVAAATLYSLFSMVLDVNAIGDGTEMALLIDDVPTPVDDVPQKKDKSQGGGGGGGGKQEKDPVNQGDLANQSPKPIRPPDPHVLKTDDPMLATPTTQGNMKFPKQYNQWGDPNSRFGGLSSGSGTGGGIGTGNGLGQGSGNGTGAGSGSGSGYGGGNGNGNGNGNGDGSGPPPPSSMAVTSPLKIIAKPKAQYTDEARQNNVQGSVTLKITLLANGTVGGITPLTRLPYGLTEKAIAAAHLIQFEPKKVNGVAVAVTKTVEYTFNIY